MTPRAAELRRLLGLSPHPEGGFYRELWRSPSDPGVRGAATTITFLLDLGQLSRWHQVDADEIWTHLEGGPLELWTWREGHDPQRQVLGPVDGLSPRPVGVVPAGTWQAARPLSAHVLCGCTVAPAFEFGGFSLLADQPGPAALLAQRHPGLKDLL